MAYPSTSRSWRREPWPWLLMAGPAAVIVAGAITSVLAFTGADGLVADDYYKQGLAINRTLQREAAADAIGLRAEVALREGRAEATLSANAPLPERIRLTLIHPARAADDRVAWLVRTADGRYVAIVTPPSAGKWKLVLETPDWRRTTHATAH